jgi:hypothetical protein
LFFAYHFSRFDHPEAAASAIQRFDYYSLDNGICIRVRPRLRLQKFSDPKGFSEPHGTYMRSRGMSLASNCQRRDSLRREFQPPLGSYPHQTSHSHSRSEVQPSLRYIDGQSVYVVSTKVCDGADENPHPQPTANSKSASKQVEKWLVSQRMSTPVKNYEVGKSNRSLSGKSTKSSNKSKKKRNTELVQLSFNSQIDEMLLILQKH